MTPQTFGERKFSNAGLLRSSAGRRWTGVAAELRSHAAGEIAPVAPTQMELTLAISDHKDARVARSASTLIQERAVRSGTLWFCPIGVTEDSIRITRPLSEVFHLYVDNSQFEALGVKASNVAYASGVEDELVRQICYRLGRELVAESAGGKLLVEQLALSLIVHLTSTHSSENQAAVEDQTSGTLDARRLKRVLDYIGDNIDGDLSLSCLAEVACLSRTHFAMAFRQTTGLPPHQFISRRRLDRAKQLLVDPATSIAEVAYACSFSSQASFTRAFQRHLGISPGAYRSQHRTSTSGR